MFWTQFSKLYTDVCLHITISRHFYFFKVINYNWNHVLNTISKIAYVCVKQYECNKHFQLLSNESLREYTPINLIHFIHKAKKFKKSQENPLIFFFTWQKGKEKKESYGRHKSIGCLAQFFFRQV